MEIIVANAGQHKNENLAKELGLTRRTPVQERIRWPKPTSIDNSFDALKKFVRTHP